MGTVRVLWLLLEKNLFGLKFSTIYKSIPGGAIYVRDDRDRKSKFRSFDTVEDGVDAYLLLLSKPRYKAVRAASTFGNAVAELENAGYATLGYYGWLLLSRGKKKGLNISASDNRDYWLTVTPYVERISIADPKGGIVRQIAPVPKTELADRVWNNPALGEFRRSENALYFGKDSKRVLPYETGTQKLKPSDRYVDVVKATAVDIRSTKRLT